MPLVAMRPVGRAAAIAIFARFVSYFKALLLGLSGLGMPCLMFLSL